MRKAKNSEGPSEFSQPQEAPEEEIREIKKDISIKEQTWQAYDLFLAMEFSEEGFSEEKFKKFYREKFPLSEYPKIDDERIETHLSWIDLLTEHFIKDKTTELKLRRFHYENAQRQLETLEGGNELPNRVEFYRYAGDEFSGVMTSEDGQVYTFFGDMAYLNLFNKLALHEGGDTGLMLIGKILREVMDEIKAEKKIKKGADLKMISLEINRRIQEKCQDKSINDFLVEKFGNEFKGVDLQLNLGFASLEEANQVFESLEMKKDYDDDAKRRNKIAELMVKIADHRSDKVRVINRVTKLSSLANMIEQKKAEKSDYKMDEFLFDRLMEHSTKALSGITVEELIQLGALRAEERFGAIKKLVDTKIGAEREKGKEQYIKELDEVVKRADDFNYEELLRSKNKKEQ